MQFSSDQCQELLSVKLPQSNYFSRTTCIPALAVTPTSIEKFLCFSNLDFKGFHEVNRITARAGTEDPKATLKLIFTSRRFHYATNVALFFVNYTPIHCVKFSASSGDLLESDGSQGANG